MMARFGSLAKAPNSSGEGPAEEDVVFQTSQELWGREHLVDLSMFSGSTGANVSGAQLPGVQAFGTARALAEVLRSVSTGTLLSAQLVEDMVKTQRPMGDDGSRNEELAAAMGYVLKLDGFNEWGLGVQLAPADLFEAVDSNGGPGRLKTAWGHLSQVGSCALVLPGQRPRVVVLLLNMPSSVPGNRVLREVIQRVRVTCGRGSTEADTAATSACQL